MALPLAAMNWFATHHGVADRRTLRTLGLSPAKIDHLVADGQLVAVHRAVYRSATWPEDGELTRALAACLAAPTAAVSLQTAARMWGLRRCAGTDVHVVVPSRHHPELAGVTVRRSATLPRKDLVHRHDGIVLTSAVRTVCDLAAVLDEDDLASVIEQVLDQFHIQYRTLRRTADALMGRGRPGSTRLRSVLDGRTPGAAAHDSHLEVRLARALVRSGLPAPVRQFPVTILPGITVHGDLAFPDVRLVIEVDHRAWHSGDQAALDKRRDRLVKLAGYDTIRVSDDDLRHRFDPTVAEVVALYRRAARRARVEP